MPPCQGRDPQSSGACDRRVVPLQPSGHRVADGIGIWSRGGWIWSLNANVISVQASTEWTATSGLWPLAVSMSSRARVREWSYTSRSPWHSHSPDTNTATVYPRRGEPKQMDTYKTAGGGYRMDNNKNTIYVPASNSRASGQQRSGQVGVCAGLCGIGLLLVEREARRRLARSVGVAVVGSGRGGAGVQ